MREGAGERGGDGGSDRGVVELLVDLAGALHKCGIYPDGHPLLAAAVAGIAARLDALLREEPVLALAVAQSQLLVDGEPVAPAPRPARRAAARAGRS